MIINVIATGSSGNLYEVLDSLGNSILIEAGVAKEKYIKYREGKTPPDMCIISHKHGDHSFYRHQYNNVCPVHKWKEKVRSMNFRVRGLEVAHGGVYNLAYFIHLINDNDYLFFGTDMTYCEEHFKPIFKAINSFKINKFLIECNYNDYLYHLADDMQRVGCNNHFSDNNVVKFFRNVKVTSPKIITIHGSERLSADTYTKKMLKAKLPTATVAVATGAKKGVKNLFKL